MTRSTLAIALWCVLAFVVFNVRFDWRTQQVAVDYTVEQLQSYQNHRPLVTINAGYRPRMQTEAGDAALWSGLILAAGIGGVALARSKES